MYIIANETIMYVQDKKKKKRFRCHSFAAAIDYNSSLFRECLIFFFNFFAILTTHSTSCEYYFSEWFIIAPFLVFLLWFLLLLLLLLLLSLLLLLLVSALLLISCRVFFLSFIWTQYLLYLSKRHFFCFTCDTKNFHSTWKWFSD